MQPFLTATIKNVYTMMLIEENEQKKKKKTIKYHGIAITYRQMQLNYNLHLLFFFTVLFIYFPFAIIFNIVY